MQLQTQEVFETIKHDLEDYSLEDVAYAADISDQTLYNWLNGTTESPRLCNIIKVAEAIGYDVRLVIL